MGAVVLLVAAWVACSVAACLVMAAVVAQADRRPAGEALPAPTAQVVPLRPTPGEGPALHDAA